jgi:glucosamine--fructose-6-phosphate aminotransferase (isomerizing)
MIHEILQEPSAVESTLLNLDEKLHSESIDLKGFDICYLTGSGSSYHACIAGQYAISSFVGAISSSIPASEFASWIPPHAGRRALTIAVSQSGESIDVLNAAKAAIENKFTVLAISNTAGSALSRIAHHTLLTSAGREKAVTATKTYVCQLAALYLLALEMKAQREGVTASLRRLRHQLLISRKILERTLEISDEASKKLAERFSGNNLFFVLGSGPNYATALEGTLKLKEAAHVVAEGFASREFLHGPMQLIGEGTPIVTVMTPDEHELLSGLISSLVRFGAPVVWIGENLTLSMRKDVEPIELSSGFHKAFTPMAYVLPLQLFAYYSSVARGLNPDKPDKLSKVVK